ncbi:GGDEF domain-containing protein [Ruminococcus sp. HUN007]|uniref:GGDEF domain-containing protein n=1 Tax=Ruminococcus sp. HUN007 TaxID=1514668 RepID=UPI0005D134DD|nr:GGDEF domain-containing protein [Ruminococcus sp. HUN007]
MSKNEKAKSESNHIVAIVIYVVAYLAMVYFAQFVLGGSVRGRVMAQYANSPELQVKLAMLTAGAGTTGQIEALLSAFIVLATNKKGYIASVFCNIANTTIVLVMAIKQHNVSAIPGFIVPISTLVLVTIIYIFANRINQKSAELSKSYEQLMETNRIIKDKDEKLSYLAYYDVLTSLPNRHLFIEKMDEAIVNNSNMPFTAILCDIDNFKLINNTYGSSAGDILLATYAEKFKGLCDDNIFLGRIGGNEYGFIMQGNNSEQNILNFIEKVQTVLAEPVQVGSDVISATASFGIASYPTNAVSSSEILTCINSAVSYAKSNGKNRPCFYEQY